MPGPDNVVGLRRRSDQADGSGGDAGLPGVPVRRTRSGSRGQRGSSPSAPGRRTRRPPDRRRDPSACGTVRLSRPHAIRRRPSRWPTDASAGAVDPAIRRARRRPLHHQAGTVLEATAIAIRRRLEAATETGAGGSRAPHGSPPSGNRLRARAEHRRRTGRPPVGCRPRRVRAARHSLRRRTQPTARRPSTALARLSVLCACQPNPALPLRPACANWTAATQPSSCENCAMRCQWLNLPVLPETKITLGNASLRCYGRRLDDHQPAPPTARLP